MPDGVRLDHGELRRIVGFVEKGGMSNARERERERLVEGPFNAVELDQKAAYGTITRETLVRADGMPDWLAAAQVLDVAARFAAP